MKKLLLSTMAVCMLFTMGFAQNISGPSDVCDANTYAYAADESPGNTHRKWLGVQTSQLASGSLSTAQIEIDFTTVGGTSLLLAWENDNFGFGGEIDIDITNQEATSIDKAACSLGSTDITAYAYSVAGATKYEFRFIGFDSGTQLCTSTTNSCTQTVNNPGVSGSIEVRVYYDVCDYGSNDGWTEYSAPANFP